LPFEAVTDVGQEAHTTDTVAYYINHREVRRPPGGGLFLEDEKNGRASESNASEKAEKFLGASANTWVIT